MQPRILFLSLVFTASLTAASAQDRVFTYTYQSTVLNTGQRELEVWNTLRSGRDGFYRGLDTRLEFEFGVAKHLQTAFYLNTTNSAMEVIPDSGENAGVPQIESESEWSFSNEWKYKLSDPVANNLGAALYGELKVGTRELELEAKIILDKQIGRTMHALNLVAEQEWETEVEAEDGGGKVEQEQEFGFEFDYGFSYNFNSNWNAGIEIRNKNEVHHGEWNASVLHAGPGFSYAHGPIWINLTLFPQLAGLRHPNPDESGLLLDGYEKFETRLLFSYAF